MKIVVLCTTRVWLFKKKIQQDLSFENLLLFPLFWINEKELYNYITTNLMKMENPINLMKMKKKSYQPYKNGQTNIKNINTKYQPRQN